MLAKRTATPVPDSTLDLSHITCDYFGDFEDPDVINTGWCYVWAWLAKLSCPEAVLYTQYTSGLSMHAFVRVGALYFDAQRPTGVPRYKLLPWYDEFVEVLGGRRPIGPMTPEHFRGVWDGGPCWCGCATERHRCRAEHPDWDIQKLKPWPTKLPRPTTPPKRKEKR